MRYVLVFSSCTLIIYLNLSPREQDPHFLHSHPLQGIRAIIFSLMIIFYIFLKRSPPFHSSFLIVYERSAIFQKLGVHLAF